MSRGYQTFFKDKGTVATVAERSASLVCSELFEDLGGDVIPLAETEVECQRTQDVYSFFKNNQNMDISPEVAKTIREVLI